MRRRFTTSVLLGLAGTACFNGQNVPTPVERITLIVSNRSYFDVNVFALRSSVVGGRRLGTVTGNSTTTVFVPSTELQPGGQLALLVRAIGSRASWISPLVSVGPGVVARLDVYATNAGDLSQSQLFTQPIIVPDSGDGWALPAALTDDAAPPRPW